MDLLLSPESGYWLFDRIFLPVVVWSLGCLPLWWTLRFLFPADPDFQTRSRLLLLWGLPASILVHIGLNAFQFPSESGLLTIPEPIALLISEPAGIQSEAPVSIFTELKPLIGWITGLSLLAGFSFLAGYLILFHRLARYHQYLEWIPETEHIRQIARDCGVRIPITVYRSSGFVTPFTFGILYPKIVIPAGYSANPVQFDLILRHELMHIRNGDYLKQILEQTLKFLFFWNPLLHLITRQISNFREMVCDERVVASCPDQKREYATLLLTHLEEPTAPTGVAAAMAHSTRNLKERIVHMKSYPTSGQNKWLQSLVAVGFTALLVSSVLATSNASFPATSRQESTVGDSTTVAPPELTGGMDALTKISQQIRYPEMDKQQGIQGRVLLNLVISKTGAIKSVQIMESTGSATLDAQAVVAAQELTFKPAMKDGQPVESEMKLPFKFKLQNEPNTARKEKLDQVTSEPEPIGGIGSVLKNIIYPAEAKKEGRSGMTVLSIQVSENGTVLKVSVAKSSGFTDLDQAAMDAAQKIQFRPALKDGKAVTADVMLPVKFKLGE